MPAAHEMYETLMKSERKNRHFLDVATASAYESDAPVRHIDDEVPGAMCVKRAGYPYEEMNRNFGNMRTDVLAKIKQIQFSWIKEIVDTKTDINRRTVLTGRILKDTELAGKGLKTSILGLNKTNAPFSALMEVKLGQHDKQLAFISHESFTLEIRTPDAVSLTIGINDDHRAAFIRLFPTNKTGQVHERLLIFNSVSRIYYTLEGVSERDGDTLKRISGNITALDKVMEIIVPRDLGDTKVDRNTSKLYISMMKKKKLMEATTCPTSTSQTLPVSCHETLFLLYKKFSDMRHLPIAEYEGSNKLDKQRNNLIVDAYAPYFAQFAKDISKLNYAYACLHSVAAALVRRCHGHEVKSTDNDSSVKVKKFSWDELNETVEQYIEHFETLDPKSPSSAKQNILHRHLFNVARMADFVSILFQKAIPEPTLDHNNLLTSLLRGGLNYQSGIGTHFGHILFCYFFHESPLQVITKPEKPEATRDEPIKYTETQKVTITNVSEQTEHVWKPLYVEFGTRAYVTSYRRHVIDALKIIFASGQYNAKTEQKKFTGRTAPGSISVKVKTKHVIHITVQQPYQILHGTTSVMKRHLPPDTASETTPPQAATAEPEREATAEPGHGDHPPP